MAVQLCNQLSLVSYGEFSLTRSSLGLRRLSVDEAGGERWCGRWPGAVPYASLCSSMAELCKNTAIQPQKPTPPLLVLFDLLFIANT